MDMFFAVIGKKGCRWAELKKTHNCTIAFVPCGNGMMNCEIEGAVEGVRGCVNDILLCPDPPTATLSPETNTTHSPDPQTSKKTKKNTVRHKRQVPRNRKLACLYCGKLLMHRIVVHLEKMHGDEIAVAEASGEKGTERANKFELIKNKGSFAHNMKVLEGKAECFIPARRQTENVDPHMYLPCTNCFGFFRKEELWRHVKHHCKFAPTGQPDGTGQRISITIQSKILLATAQSEDGTSPDLAMLNEALLASHDDDVKQAIVNDELIKKLGSVLLNKLGMRRKNSIVQRMRQLARLKIACKATYMKDLIKGSSFDLVVSGVKELVVPEQNEEGITVYKSPSLALTLGHNLKKVASVLFGVAMRRDDHVSMAAAETFLKLMNLEWADKISTIAVVSLKTNKHNIPQLLPVTDDLVKLKQYLVEVVAEKVKLLGDGISELSAWKELAEATLAWLLLFNKRRGNEVAMMLVSSYKERPKWKESANQEIMSTFSDLEKHMVDRYFNTYFS